jgi:hypothetical protein
VGRWLTGAHPQPSVLMRIADALRIRSDWLVDGQGEMDRNDQAEDEDGLKEPKIPNRLREPSTVLRSHVSSRLPTVPTPAITAAASRLTIHELESILTTSVSRLLEEEQPLLKLGYLATLKACVADMERRLADEPK